jgi:hypothetical protein
MTNIEGSESGSGSISQRHGSKDPDPDPPQNVMDPQHWPEPKEIFSAPQHSLYTRVGFLYSTRGHFWISE